MVLFGEVLHELDRLVHLCVRIVKPLLHFNALLVDLRQPLFHFNALLVDLLVLYAKALAYVALHGGPPAILLRCVILVVEDVVLDLVRKRLDLLSEISRCLLDEWRLFTGCYFL